MALAATAVLAVAALLITAVDRMLPEVMFPIAKVMVQGRLQYQTPEQVFSVAAADAAGGFFSVDTNVIRAKVAALPWVKQVTVRRLWPATVAVHVVEREPVALWTDGRLLDQDGELFSAQLPTPLQLPRLTGPQGCEQQLLRKYADLRTLLAPLAATVRELTLDERRAWTVTLSNELVLYVGRDFKAQRLERLVRYFPRLFAGREQGMAALDLRYTNGISVRWKPGVDPEKMRVQDVQEG